MEITKTIEARTSVSLAQRLTGDSILARNAVINFLGRVVPLGIAIFAIPVLIRTLGTERFGVLTLVWIVIGYFSIFDLGLGRALTKFVAARLGSGQQEDLAPMVWTGVSLMAILGLAGALVVGLVSPWLVHRVLNVPTALERETLQSFYLLAVCIPFVTSASGLIGVLEALQRFGAVNSVRTLMGAYMYLSPLVVAPFSQSLFSVVIALAIGRLLSWLIYLRICFRAMPTLRQRVVIQGEALRPLLGFGGWITISNIVDPLMVYLDRFLIGSMVSMTAVAYYTTPHEIVTKLLIFPGAIAGVLFPAFSTGFEQDRRRVAWLFARGLKSVLVVLFPVTLLFIVFAREGLDLWLGREFASASTFVLQCLAAGVFLNGLAYIPAVFIQAMGRPEVTGKLHLIELPVYLLLVWWMISAHGIEGAALAWGIRAAFDVFVLLMISKRLLREASS